MHHPNPECIIIAGPPGSGKSSTITINKELDYFNPDDKAKELSRNNKSISPEIKRQAGRFCDDFINTHIKDRKDFCIETDLHTIVTFLQSQEAKAVGFILKMVYVCLDNPDKNVCRIIGRSQDGGPAEPKDQIKKAYDKSLKNLSVACKEFDQVVSFDNSGENPLLIFEIKNGKLKYLKKEAPAWAIDSLKRAGLVQDIDFRKYEILVYSKADSQKYTHYICVPKSTFQDKKERDKEDYLHEEAAKFIEKHPVLSQQNGDKFIISIKPS